MKKQITITIVGNDNAEIRKKGLALNKIGQNPALSGEILAGIAENGAALLGGTYGGLIKKKLKV